MGVINLNSNQEETPKVAETVEEHIQEEQNPAINNINEEKAKTEIKLDGPLSSIFTKALNAAYANESLDMPVVSAIEQDEVEENIEQNELENEDKFGNALYVYCCDGNNLSQEGLVNAANRITKIVGSGRYRNIILSMECFNGANNKTALLDKLGSSLGVKVCLSQRSTMEAIKKSIRG